MLDRSGSMSAEATSCNQKLRLHNRRCTGESWIPCGKLCVAPLVKCFCSFIDCFNKPSIIGVSHKNVLKIVNFCVSC